MFPSLSVSPHQSPVFSVLRSCVVPGTLSWLCMFPALGFFLLPVSLSSILVCTSFGFVFLFSLLDLPQPVFVSVVACLFCRLRLDFWTSAYFIKARFCFFTCLTSCLPFGPHIFCQTLRNTPLCSYACRLVCLSVWCTMGF